MVFQRINVDLLRPSAERVIYAVQDDQYSRGIELSIYENNIPYSIPNGTSVVFSYKKPDGTGGNYDALPDGKLAYSVSGNIVTVSLAPQVLAVPGVVEFVVGLITGTSKIHTFLMSIDVQAKPGLYVDSEDYFNIIGAVPSSGWAANMYLGTDENGRVVVKSAPSEDGGQTGGVTFFPFVDSEGNLSWSNNGGLENPTTVNIKGADGTPGRDGKDGATVQEVLEEMPTVTAMDFSNFENGSFSETADGKTLTYAVTFDTAGRPVSVGGIAITWGA